MKDLFTREYYTINLMWMREKRKKEERDNARWQRTSNIQAIQRKKEREEREVLFMRVFRVKNIYKIKIYIEFSSLLFGAPKFRLLHGLFARTVQTDFASIHMYIEEHMVYIFMYIHI